MQEDFKSLKPEQLEALKQLLGEAYNVQLPDASDWFDGKQIDEIAFGEYLLRKKERKCIHGKLYDLDGEISDEVIRKEILDEIRPYQKINVAKMVDLNDRDSPSHICGDHQRGIFHAEGAG